MKKTVAMILGACVLSTPIFAQTYTVRKGLGDTYTVENLYPTQPKPPTYNPPPAQRTIYIPSSLFTMPDTSYLNTANQQYNQGIQSQANANYLEAAAANMRQQTALMRDRAAMEQRAQQRAVTQAAIDSELGEQKREAELAEARLRKEQAEAKLAELRLQQAEQKIRDDAAEQIRRQEAQKRFEDLKAQIQQESEAKAKSKLAQTQEPKSAVPK